MIRVGYACINYELLDRPNVGFRLKSFNEKRFLKTVQNNLNALEKTIQWNIEHKIHFFRISSDTIPFASHPICTINWKKRFQSQLEQIGELINSVNMRIAMHPGQFVVLNSPNAETRSRAVAELQYHADLLDIMKLDATAKIQIHVGGVYGDKITAIDRWCEQYHLLTDSITNRLVIEHDERSFSLADCLMLSKQVSIPIIVDSLHHRYLNSGETLAEAIGLAADTWKPGDGVPMIDYSSQDSKKQQGAHGIKLNSRSFKTLLQAIGEHDADIMLEVKDKQESALRAVRIIETQ